MYLSRIPPGMRYYVGAEARLRRRVEDTAMSVFDSWSYEEIATPAVDYYLLFEQGMGSNEAQRSFRFTDVDGRMLTLRPDVTSSVARAAATLLASRVRPLRLCYATPVFQQQSRSTAEWRRENTQLGCELIGDGKTAADVEMLLLAAEILKELGLQNSYCITLNNVEVFNGLAEHYSLSSVERDEILRLIDRRATPELNGYSISIEARRAFTDLITLTGKRKVLQEAEELILNPRSKAAIARLETVWQAIESNNLTESFDIDLADVSNLDYYTELNFKIFVRGAGSRVGGGGRYDKLLSNFGASEPAIGFVLNLDGLTEILARHREPGRSDISA